MDTRLDDQADEHGGDTWVDEVTVPDLDATKVDGEAWPPRSAVLPRFFSKSPPSGFEWR